MSTKILTVALLALILGGTAFAQWGYDCQGYYGYLYTCDQDNDAQTPQLRVELDSTCDGLLVTVTSGGDGVNGAHVSVKAVPSAELLASGDTDPDGEVLFPGLCGEKVDVKATRTGYKSDTVTTTLIACEQCPGEEGCTSDDQCLSDQRCSQGDCVPVPCECGQVTNHECLDYQCCSDADCPAGQTCRDNACEEGGEEPESEFQCMSDADCAPEEYCAIAVGAAGGTCEPVTGECGYVEDHKFVPYECGDDESCPACPQGETCTGNECVLYELNCPTTGAAGEEVTCVVTEDGVPCANCEVEVTDPDGNTVTVMTDENGNVELPVGEPGNYMVVLPKNGQQMNVQIGGAADAGAPGEEPDGGEGDPFSWLLLLLLLVLLGAGILYLTGKR